MNASLRYWSPKSAPSNVRLILAVDRGPAPAGELDAATYRSLMAAKVAALVKAAGPEEAARILEASPEQLPELMAIRDSQPEATWPQALMESDLMQELLNKIDWSKESGNRPMLPPQNEIRDALRETTLDELIEKL